MPDPDESLEPDPFRDSYSEPGDLLGTAFFELGLYCFAGITSSALLQQMGLLSHYLEWHETHDD